VRYTCRVRNEQSIIAAFVKGSKRDRYREIVSDQRLRHKFTHQFAHFTDFDPEYRLSIPSNKLFVDNIARELHKRHSPAIVFAISEDPGLDQKELPLVEALKRTVGRGMGTILSCIPGRLAFVETEDERFILERHDSPENRRTVVAGYLLKKSSIVRACSQRPRNPSESSASQRLCGEISGEGKSVSRYNALKSGIDSAAEVALPSESFHDLCLLTTEYFERFCPRTPEQRCLVDTLVSSEWLLRRLRRIEGELLTNSCKDLKQSEERFALGNAFDENSRSLERLQRRVNATTKIYMKTLQLLNQLQEPPKPLRILPARAGQSQPAETLPSEIGFVPAILDQRSFASPKSVRQATDSPCVSTSAVNI
jgi:hypothetical protein